MVCLDQAEAINTIYDRLTSFDYIYDIEKRNFVGEFCYEYYLMCASNIPNLLDQLDSNNIISTGKLWIDIFNKRRRNMFVGFLSILVGCLLFAINNDQITISMVILLIGVYTIWYDLSNNLLKEKRYYTVFKHSLTSEGMLDYSRE